MPNCLKKTVAIHILIHLWACLSPWTFKNTVYSQTFRFLSWQYFIVILNHASFIVYEIKYSFICLIHLYLFFLSIYKSSLFTKEVSPDL